MLHHLTMTAIAAADLFAQDNGDGSTGGSLLSFLLPLVIIGGFFYLIFVLPQRRRMRQVEEMRSAVDVGDQIRTVGGIVGTVVEMAEDTVVVDTGHGSRITFAKRAIATRIQDEQDQMEDDVS